MVLRPTTEYENGNSGRIGIPACRFVLVDYSIDRQECLSSPRNRLYSWEDVNDQLAWIPACAGMTDVKYYGLRQADTM